MAADVGVSVSVSQPGFYGRIDLGGAPAPVLMYPQPVIIRPVPVAVVRQPIYLRVPPGHEKNWGKYCQGYNACGQPVYFVQDRWYREVYTPRYKGAPAQGYDRRDDRRDHGHHGKSKRGHDRD